jgi:hypothetical protein
LLAAPGAAGDITRGSHHHLKKSPSGIPQGPWHRMESFKSCGD